MGNQYPPTTATNQVPPSTTVARMATIQAFLDEEEEEEESDENVMEYYSRMVPTNLVMEVNVNAKRISMNLVTNEVFKIAICDSGADTCILGQGWVELSRNII